MLLLKQQESKPYKGKESTNDVANVAKYLQRRRRLIAQPRGAPPKDRAEKPVKACPDPEGWDLIQTHARLSHRSIKTNLREERATEQKPCREIRQWEADELSPSRHRMWEKRILDESTAKSAPQHTTIKINISRRSCSEYSHQACIRPKNLRGSYCTP
jgi:hypothetical protein